MKKLNMVTSLIVLIAVAVQLTFVIFYLLSKSESESEKKLDQTGMDNQRKSQEGEIIDSLALIEISDHFGYVNSQENYELSQIDFTCGWLSVMKLDEGIVRYGRKTIDTDSCIVIQEFYLKDGDLVFVYEVGQCPFKPANEARYYIHMGRIIKLVVDDQSELKSPDDVFWLFNALQEGFDNESVFDERLVASGDSLCL